MLAGGWRPGYGAFWLIEGFRTFEEAFAYVLGYDSRFHPRWRILQVVHEAIRRFQRQEYTPPRAYYIVPGIPPIPGQISPPSPADILPWSTSPNSTTPGIFRSSGEPRPTRTNPLGGVSVSFDANVDFIDDLGFSDLNLNDSCANRSPSPSRDNRDPNPSVTLQSSISAQSGIDSSSGTSRTPRFCLNFAMENYLTTHYSHITRQNLDAFNDYISSVPGRNAESILLARDMLTSEFAIPEAKAVFFAAWIFDVCPRDSIWHADDSEEA